MQTITSQSAVIHQWWDWSTRNNCVLPLSMTFALFYYIRNLLNSEENQTHKQIATLYKICAPWKPQSFVNMYYANRLDCDWPNMAMTCDARDSSVSYWCLLWCAEIFQVSGWFPRGEDINISLFCGVNRKSIRQTHIISQHRGLIYTTVLVTSRVKCTCADMYCAFLRWAFFSTLRCIDEYTLLFLFFIQKKIYAYAVACTHHD